MLARREPNFGSDGGSSFSTVALPPSTDAPRPTSESASTNPGPNLGPAASPPLILAFLAIGLFTAAMVAVFGCRRVQFGRREAARARRIDARRSAVVGLEFEEKPELWDLWTVPGMVDGDGGWENIMPFSAHTITTAASASATTATASETHPVVRSDGGWNGPISGTLQRGMDSVALRFRGRPTLDEKIEEVSQTRRLQVAVPIMMPSQQDHHRLQQQQQQRQRETADDSATKEKDNPSRSADERLVYSIGLFEVPWHSDGW